MKKTLQYLLILSAAFLFSCKALHNGNFNKRKYTHLKSSTTLIAEPNAEESVAENTEITYDHEQLNDEPCDTINEQIKTVPPTIENVSIKSQFEENPKEIFRRIVKWPSVKSDFHIRPKKEINKPGSTFIIDSDRPYFVAWIVQSALIISGLLVLIATIYIILPILFYIGFGLIFIGLIYAAILAIIVSRKQKKSSSRLLKVIKLVTLLELVITGGLIVIGLLLLLIVVLALFIGGF